MGKGKKQNKRREIIIDQLYKREKREKKEAGMVYLSINLSIYLSIYLPIYLYYLSLFFSLSILY
jgi:hypothetical protein